MSTRRIIISVVLALLAFLGMYTWNQRTGQWDWLAANSGLEIAGGVLRAVHGVGDTISSIWNRYIALIDVQEENDQLKTEIQQEQSSSGSAGAAAGILGLAAGGGGGYFLARRKFRP